MNDVFLNRRTPIPMEILSWLSPILAPVDGLGTMRHRAGLLWNLAPTATREREELWLGNRFPYHAEEAIDASRRAVQQRGGGGAATKVSDWLSAPLERASSPRLAAIFHHVWQRYLRWSGNQLVVRAGRTEELHNLALLFPVSQLVHHAHARALSLGHASRERLRELSWQPHHLPSESAALTTLAGRGLAEGHVHLGGVMSAEEVWADHLLNRSARARRRGDEARERLLDEVNRLILRFTVLASLLMHRWQVRGLVAVELERWEGKQIRIGLFDLHRLLDAFDEVCALPDFNAARDRAAILNRELQPVIDVLLAEGDPARGRGGWLDPAGYEIAVLLLAPHRFVLGRHHRFPPFLRTDPRLPTAVHRRRAAIDWLHLELHRLLLALPAGQQLLYQPEGARQRWLEPAAADGGGFEHALQGYVERVFSSYLVLLTIHHYLGTHRGRRMGLRRFQEFFKARQRRPLRSGFSSPQEVQDYTAAQVRALLTAPDIRLVEGRVAPSSGGRKTIRPWLLGYDEAWNSSRPGAGRPWRCPREKIAFGLVVHFKKAADPPRLERTYQRLLAPYRLPRYHRCREKTRRQALDLFRFLRRPDPQVPFVVGIDAAGHELAAPPEVFAPAFCFLRQEPIDCQPASLLRWSTLHKRSFFRMIEGRRLGMTFHVGEDFRHLLSGLRAIWEAITFLAPAPGDRLGHVIAAGVDPATWARLLAGQTLVPRQEWLDDLVWVWHFLGPGHDLLGRLKIEDEIQKHAAILYQSGCGERFLSPLDLYHAWTLRAIDPACLALEDDAPWGGRETRCGPGDRRDRIERFRNRLGTGLENERWIEVQRRCLDQLEPRQMRRVAFELHWLYLYDPRVAWRGEEMLTLELEPPWLELCNLAQDRLRSEIHRRQLVVEMNPTSNRLIGPMAGIPDHHIFRLTREHDNAPALLATVNTDDPGVFQTSLPHEFYLLGEELLARGEEEGEVLRWLDQLRVTGLETSFLKRLQEVPLEVRCEVLDDLRRLYGRSYKTRDLWLEPVEDAGARRRWRARPQKSGAP